MATKKEKNVKARDKFKEIRKKVKIKDVLDYYGFLNGLKRGEDKLISCPLCGENHHRKSFQVNTANNTWRCVSCEESGDVLDFISFLEDVDVRVAAYLLKKWFAVICEEDRKLFEKES